MELVLDATAEDLKVFLEEAEEQLQLLDADLIALEKTGADPELLQEIFRVAHTLKGSSASIGHNRMAQLTHAMESVLDGLRHGDIEVSGELIDILLESLDALQILTGEVTTLKVTDNDLSPLVSRLLRITEQNDSVAATNAKPKSDSFALNEAQRNLIQEHEALGNSIYQVVVAVDKHAPLASARGVQILLGIAELADIIRSTPNQAELEAGASSDKLEIICGTRMDADQIVSAVSSMVDVVSVKASVYNTEADPVVNEGPAGVETQVSGAAVDERIVDLGPKARGKSKDDMQRMTAAKLSQQAKTVRIDVERLDRLMNLVGELVIDNTRLARIANRIQAGLPMRI